MEAVDEIYSRKYLPQHVLKDGAKWLMMPSKIILDGLSLWPERQNNVTKTLNFFNVFSYFCFIVGNCYYVTRKGVDLGSTAFALSLLIISVESSARIILSQVYKEKLSKILSTVYYEFWSSDVAGNAIHEDVLKGSRYLFTYTAGYMSIAVLCVLQYILLPYFTRNLPLRGAYPFSWQASPYYELLYIWQSFIVMAAPFTVCGLDLFFVSLVYNCVAQFKILRSFVKIHFERAIQNNMVEANEVLMVCIHRHNKLIKACNEIDETFTFFILMQYLINVGTICLSSFTITVVPEEIGSALTYLMGHMSEIFIYCYMGNELILESTALSDAVFECGWHLTRTDQDLQKSLIMIMVRSQKPMQISTGGFGFLSMPSFMRLIHFAFSVYTLLNSLLKKQNMSG